VGVVGFYAVEVDMVVEGLECSVVFVEPGAEEGQQNSLDHQETEQEGEDGRVESLLVKYGWYDSICSVGGKGRGGLIINCEL
jgi:hypothetical protein